MTNPMTRREAFRSRHGIRWIDAMKDARDGKISIRTWWGCDGLSGEEFRRWFHRCLTDKINTLGGIWAGKEKWRNIDIDEWWRMRRDAKFMLDTARHPWRREGHRFESRVFRKRYGHLTNITNED